MIHLARAGEEEAEARRCSRRGFLRMALGGAAAAAAPARSYFFFGQVLRPRDPWEELLSGLAHLPQAWRQPAREALAGSILVCTTGVRSAAK